MNWIFTPSIQKNQSGVLPDIRVLSVLTFGLKYKIRASGKYVRDKRYEHRTFLTGNTLDSILVSQKTKDKAGYPVYPDTIVLDDNIAFGCNNDMELTVYLTAVEVELFKNIPWMAVIFGWVLKSLIG